MRTKVTLALIALALGGVLGACANTGIPPGGPHFASWTHAKYSVRGEEKPPLTRPEFDQAKREEWWGIPVPYTIDELE